MNQLSEKNVKEKVTDKDKVDIKFKLKKLKNKNKGAFKCKNDKGEITVAKFSDNDEEDEKIINDTSDGLTMYCDRCSKEVDVNDYCKACDDKLSAIHEKK